MTKEWKKLVCKRSRDIVFVKEGWHQCLWPIHEKKEKERVTTIFPSALSLICLFTEYYAFIVTSLLFKSIGFVIQSWATILRNCTGNRELFILVPKVRHDLNSLYIIPNEVSFLLCVLLWFLIKGRYVSGKWRMRHACKAKRGGRGYRGGFL